VRPTTPQARALMPLFKALAGASGLGTRRSVNISVSTRNRVPEMRAGTVYLPSELVPMLDEEGRGPIIFAHTFLHELQHAIDFSNEATADWTREDHEVHARAAERLLSDEQILIFVRRHPMLEVV
jgi:hypothetical protein